MLQGRALGDAILVFVTFCWGITFPVVENAVKVLDPVVFVTVRFFVAALILLPFIWPAFRKANHKKLFVPAVILGLLNVVAYNGQTIGLETVSAAKCAFILGSYVIMVPFLLPLFRMGTPSRLDKISSFFCLIGLSLLTGLDFGHMNVGCLWIIFSALGVAMGIIYLQKISEKSESLSVLAFYQILFTAIFSFPLTLGKSYSPVFHSDALIGLAFCAIFATTISLLLQTKYQRLTTAPRAAMIFCLEPVFAAIFGYLINGEVLKPMAFLGGFLIIISILIPEFYRVWQLKKIEVA